MNRNLALALSALSGFIALSYEILWFRTYGFLTEGSPQAFSDLMAAYLFGLTGGAFLPIGSLERTLRFRLRRLAPEVPAV